MPLDPGLIAETQAWLQKAGDDLEASRRCLEQHPPLYAIGAFLAQQTAEKALKAFLTFHQTDFDKTHNLRDLGEQCLGIDASLASIASEAGRLTRYAVEGRYPGPWRNPTEAEASAALSVAVRVHDAIAALLPAETKP